MPWKLWQMPCSSEERSKRPAPHPSVSPRSNLSPFSRAINDEGCLVTSDARAVTGGCIRRSGFGTFQSRKDFSPDFAFASCHRVVHCTVCHGALNNLLRLIVSHNCSAGCEAMVDLSSRGCFATHI